MKTGQLYCHSDSAVVVVELVHQMLAVPYLRRLAKDGHEGRLEEAAVAEQHHHDLEQEAA